MYGIAILPQMKCAAVPGVKHKWYADDGNAVESIDDLETLELLKPRPFIWLSSDKMSIHNEMRAHTICKRKDPGS